MQFEIHYRKSSKDKPLTYELILDKDRTGRPYVKEERLWQSKGIQGNSEYIMFFKGSQGYAYTDETHRTDNGSCNPLNKNRQEITFVDKRKLGLSVLGSMKGFSRIKDFKDFLSCWYVCKFAPNQAKQMQTTGQVTYLNQDGSNLNSVVQYMYRENPEVFRKALSSLKNKFPNIEQIRPVKMPNDQIVLEFKQSNLQEPLYSTQMSDGIVKLLAYYLLLNEKNPRTLLFLAEPENYLYHTHISEFASELKQSIGSGKQIFITTNSPFLINVLSSDDVWVLKSGMNGFSELACASSYEFVKALTEEGTCLGDLWYNHYFE